MNKTKHKIIHIAFDLIKERGYDQITINDICEKAKVSKHTFYYYFNSKEDLLADFRVIPEEVSQENLAKILSLESPFEQLMSLIIPKIEHFESIGPEVARKIFFSNLHENKGNSYTDKPNVPFYQLEMDLIAKSQNKGEIRNTSDPEKLARSCFMLMVGCLSCWTMSNGQMELRKMLLNNIHTLLQVDEDLIHQFRI